MQLTSANMVPTHMPLMFQLLFQLSYEQCKEKKKCQQDFQSVCRKRKPTHRKDISSYIGILVQPISSCILISQFTKTIHIVKSWVYRWSLLALIAAVSCRNHESHPKKEKEKEPCK